MVTENNRVLAHDLCRELTIDELEVIAGGMATSTTVASNGGSSSDSDQ